MSFSRTWDLESVYSGIADKKFLQDISTVEGSIDGLTEAARGLRAGDAPPWESFFRRREEWGLLFSQVGVFVNCLASTDTENSEYPVLLGRFSAIGAKAADIGILLRENLGGLSEAEFAALLEESPYLADIRFHLEEIRRSAAHMMDAPREALAAKLSVDGQGAWSRLYTKLSGKLKVQVMENGELVSRSVAQIRFDSPEATVRRNNFFAANKAWKTVADSCAAALNHISGSRLTLYREQGYEHFLDRPLEDNRLERRSLDAMWRAIEARTDILLPYIEAKAKLLNQEKLNWFDQVAPLGGGRIDFDEAAGKIIELFGSFNPEMGRFAQDCFERRFVESEDRAGKRPGAYCTKFSLRKEPRVFMTFNDTYDAMSTLAHELGHAYHGFVLRDRPQVLQAYTMSTAETASTFAEEIVTDWLIENSADPREKLAMLDKSLADSMVFLMNIQARFKFESELYTRRATGELRVEELEELMVASQKEAFRDSFGEWDPMFWASKLHFYIAGLSFYNFPYTFGYLFSNGLYARAKKTGPAFAETYKDILIRTGCMQTEEVISSTLGQDIGTTAFWDASIDLIEARAKQFVDLAGEVGRI